MWKFWGLLLLLGCSESFGSTLVCSAEVGIGEYTVTLDTHTLSMLVQEREGYYAKGVATQTGRYTERYFLPTFFAEGFLLQVPQTGGEMTFCLKPQDCHSCRSR